MSKSGLLGGKKANKMSVPVVGSALLALFWVVFVWGFWSQGVYALGVNTFVFLLGMVLMYNPRWWGGQAFERRDWAWLVPVGLLMLSFLLYDNPFIKTVNLVVYPLMFAFFYSYRLLSRSGHPEWNISLMTVVWGRVFSFGERIGRAWDMYMDRLVPIGKDYQTILKQVLIGVVSLLALAFLIIIPLLSAADAGFAEKMGVMYQWLGRAISWEFVYKLVMLVVVAVGLLATVVAWAKKLEYRAKRVENKIDSIVAGIVVGGILLLYGLFLWVQAERLWIGQLPFDFATTESLVKSGFWQLWWLSIINIAIYFFVYRGASSVIRGLLGVFTVASLLLLVIAGHRVGMYAVYYGLSYEKFFAVYTVLYCAVLFVWLLGNVWRKRGADVLRFIVMLFVWMYAVVAVLPMEQLIYRSNAALWRLEGSRINMYELTMLSPDVLSLAKRDREAGILIGRYSSNEDISKVTKRWENWIADRERIVSDKSWYEMNVMNVLYRAGW